MVQRSRALRAARIGTCFPWRCLFAGKGSRVMPWRSIAKDLDGVSMGDLCLKVCGAILLPMRMDGKHAVSDTKILHGDRGTPCGKVGMEADDAMGDVRIDAKQDVYGIDDGTCSPCLGNVWSSIRHRNRDG